MSIGREMADTVRFHNKWIKHLLLDAWPIWATIGVPVICLIIAKSYQDGEQIVRLSGLALQFGGYLITVINMIGTQKAHGAPTLRQRLSDYFRSFPTRNVTVSLGASISARTSSSGKLAKIRNPKATIEERLVRLESDADQSTESIQDARKELSSAHIDLEKRMLSEASDLDLKIGDVRGLVRSAMTDSLTLQWIGIAYFAVGIWLGTASPEIACWLGDAKACKF